MLGILSMFIAVGAAWFGYGTARRFVRTRLRYVDSAQSSAGAVIAAVGATLIAWPIAWVLPLVSGGTALAFGIAVGLGTRAGADDVRHGYTLTDGR